MPFPSSGLYIHLLFIMPSEICQQLIDLLFQHLDTAELSTEREE